MDSAFEKIFDISFDMLAVLGLDGKFKNVNRAFLQTLGWTAQEIIEKTFWEIVMPDTNIDLKRAAQNLAQGHPLIFTDSKILCQDGSERALRWTAYPDMETKSIYLIMETKSQETDQELFKLAVEASPTVILIVDQGEILYANRLSEMVFGYPQDELIGKNVEMLVPRRLQPIHKHRREEYDHQPYLRLMGSNLDLVGKRKDGNEFPLDIGLNPVRTADKIVVVCSVIDLTKRKAVEALIKVRINQLENEISELDKLALTDELTAISNRRALYRHLELHFRIAQKENHPISFVLMDIDNFKYYNDTYGHVTGDEVLKTIAEIMAKSIRHTEIVARFGGEEFAAILPMADANDAILLTQRLRKTIAEYPWPFRGITISIGVATLYPKASDSISPDDIKMFINMADKALYSSKSNGKNAVTHFNNLYPKPDENLLNWHINHDTTMDGLGNPDSGQA
jgi:diguanylate cyclase (GGDEF)-like protein/PAS domain S-box-containing protein